jgi:hypothetical protein
LEAEERKGKERGAILSRRPSPNIPLPGAPTTAFRMHICLNGCFIMQPYTDTISREY